MSHDQQTTRMTPAAFQQWCRTLALAPSTCDYLTTIRGGHPVRRVTSRGNSVNGSRPFGLVHIDHTELDIEVRCPFNGQLLGKPWFTFMMDAYSQRLLAVYLTFDPPSYRSVMMVLRICVQRFDIISLR